MAWSDAQSQASRSKIAECEARMLAWLALLIFLLCFTLSPIGYSSGF